VTSSPLPAPASRSIDSRSIFIGVIYTLLVFGYVFRAFYIAEHDPMGHIWSDPQRHWEQGIDVMRDDPMTLTDPVLYQLYISAFAKLTYGDPALSAFYTIFLAFLMPWLWYRFFRELQPSKEIALFGWVVITWLPSWLSIYAYFMQETIMLPMLGAALWATWRCQRKATLNAFLLMVFIWILAGLSRGICIPMAAVAATWLWSTQDKKIPKALLSLAILGLALGPLTYRSWQKMHMIAPHGIGQMNILYAKSGKKELQIKYTRKGAVWFYGYGSPATGSKPFSPFSDWQTKRTGKVFVEIDVDKGSEDWKKHAELNTLSFRKYLWIASENLILLMFDPSWPDSNLEYPLGYINHHMRWLWLPLGLITILLTGFYWHRHRGSLNRQDLLLPSIFVGWFIVQGLLPLAINEGRYRKPYEGLIIAQLLFLAGHSRRIQQGLKAAKNNNPEQLTPAELPVQRPEIAVNSTNDDDQDKVNNQS